MQNKQLISVIIASYNHEAFVKQAVESVLDQSHQNIQVIVVDDGSTDKTAKIVAQIKDKRLKIIKLKENRRFHPRNIGLKSSKGEYIAFQNSDDVWDKLKLEKQLKYLEQHPKTGAVFTQVKIIDKNGKILQNSWADHIFDTANKNRIEWLKHFLIKGNCLCISSALVRKDILDRVGAFNESLVQLSDFDMWVRIAAVSEIYILPQKLTQMRIVKGKNFSGPSTQSINRGSIELLQVLRRYSQEPIINQMGKIIPGKLKSFIPSKIIQQGRLIQKCWQIGSPVHLLFATQLGNELLANPQNRQILTAFFGTSFIQNYISIKGKVKLDLSNSSK